MYYIRRFYTAGVADGLAGVGVVSEELRILKVERILLKSIIASFVFTGLE